MHIPDGFVDAPTSLAAAGVSAGVLAVAVRRTHHVLGDRQVPLAALTAAFVFAAQMVTFPVAGGTSGHLLGGVLAAVLVGPWTGVVCLTVVLSVQALLFADGGLSALGLNVLNLAVVGCLGGYLVFLVARRALARVPGRVPAAAAVAALASVPLAAAALTVELAIGGATGVAVGDVAAAMVGTHALIGIGEAVITFFALGSVLAARPDLVHGTDPLTAPLELRPSAVAAS